MNAPFPIDPALVAITIAYRNASYIADAVLPRVPVSKQDFRYWQYPIEETLALPDTRVGRRGVPNEVSLSAAEQSSFTEDYGLDDPIPQADIDNAPPNHSPIDRSVVQLTEYLMLAREKRTADLVFNPVHYPSGHKVQLVGDQQWSNYSESNPLDDIKTGLDSALMRPNVMVLGHGAWSKLSSHPVIVQAIHGNSVDKGIVRRAQVAELFELEEILVGQSRLNTAAKGQPAALSGVWGNHCALIYRDRNADTRSGLTFGYTAEWGSRVSGTERDSRIGLRGGQRVRVGESVRELIAAPGAAYFLQDVA